MTERPSEQSNGVPLPTAPPMFTRPHEFIAPADSARLGCVKCGLKVAAEVRRQVGIAP